MGLEDDQPLELKGTVQKTGRQWGIIARRQGPAPLVRRAFSLEVKVELNPCGGEWLLLDFFLPMEELTPRDAPGIGGKYR